MWCYSQLIYFCLLSDVTNMPYLFLPVEEWFYSQFIYFCQLRSGVTHMTYLFPPVEEWRYSAYLFLPIKEWCYSNDLFFPTCRGVMLLTQPIYSYLLRDDVRQSIYLCMPIKEWYYSQPIYSSVGEYICRVFILQDLRIFICIADTFFCYKVSGVNCNHGNPNLLLRENLYNINSLTSQRDEVCIP